MNSGTDELSSEAAAALTFAVDDLAPATPPALTDLLAGLPTRRHARFVDDVARLLDVDSSCADRLLGEIDDAARWEPGFLPNMELLHVDGGAKVTDAITGFVRLPAGAHFPTHRHLGDEQVLILQGYCREGDTTLGPGSIITRPAGSEHSFDVIEGGCDLLYLAIVHVGLELGELVLRADDPRA
ncbi:MAG: hypothetical protein GXP55_09510 [Deltaproteobacteria bacterium]|nr:hypothetical protein [Deltaproteobacteria bacterium]